MEFSKPKSLCLFTLLLLSPVQQMHAQVMEVKLNSQSDMSSEWPAASDFSVEALGGHVSRPVVYEPESNEMTIGRANLDKNTGSQHSAFLTVVGGIGFGSLGMLAGALVGAGSLGGAIYGGIAGGTIMFPVGAHIGNSRRGNVGSTFAIALLVAGGGVVLAAKTRKPEFLAPIPIVQFLTSVIVELTSSR